jgi:hypothetical protein
MTALTNLLPEYSYGDVITTTNNGQGFTAALLPIQDGLGNQSPMSLSTQAVNFDRSGPFTFRLDNVALTASSANINSICGANPTFLGNVPLILPKGNVEPAPVNGMIWYNEGTNQLRAVVNGLWVTIA